MSLRTDGFLSPDSANWITRHRSEHEPWFALADRLNRVAQRLMLDAIVPAGDSQSLLVLLFYARTLSSFQGALLLVERAMTVEARTLARSCLESAFYLGAVANDIGFIDQLIRANTAHKRKVANWLTSRGAAVAELSDDQLKRLGEFLGDLKSSGAITDSIVMQQAAQKADLGDIYEVVYRDLSNSAAHPSLDSLLRHIELDGNENFVGLRFGPDPKDIRDTILAMTTALFCAVSMMTKFFPNEACGSELDACWVRHKQFVAVQGDAA